MISKFIIQPENSVPTQKIPALSVPLFLDECLDLKFKSIIDVGAGKTRHIPLLLKNFKKIWAVETHLQLQRTEKRIVKFKQYRQIQDFLSTDEFSRTRLNADSAICVCVLQAIPKKSDREQLLKNIFKNLAYDARLMIDVPFGEPYYKKKFKKSNSYLDGHIFGKKYIKTFHKEFDYKELKKFIENSGFKYENDIPVRRHHALVFSKT